jgi:hypothetical protein
MESVETSAVAFNKAILNDRFVILKHMSEGGTAKVKLALDL